MPNPPPRKRFQIHLSTAIVMMFVAGGLMWVNTSRHERTEIKEEIVIATPNYIPKKYYFTDEYRGWPFVAHVNFVKSEHLDHSLIASNDGSFQTTIDYFLIICDSLVAISTLFITWFLCEWLIRRRAARKES